MEELLRRSDPRFWMLHKKLLEINPMRMHLGVMLMVNLMFKRLGSTWQMTGPSPDDWAAIATVDDSWGFRSTAPVIRSELLFPGFLITPFNGDSESLAGFSWRSDDGQEATLRIPGLYDHEDSDQPLLERVRRFEKAFSQMLDYYKYHERFPETLQE
jgi:hypothetical protein